LPDVKVVRANAPVEISRTNVLGFLAAATRDYEIASAQPTLQQIAKEVKGRTENALLQMPFKAVFLFRPAYIQPLHGIRTKTRWYGAAYALMRPLYPLLKMLFPNYVTTTECVGRAMLSVTKRGFPKPVLENRDINGMCR